MNEDTKSQYNLGMEKLLVVVQELSLAHSLEDVMGIVRVAARQLTGADGATFVLRDKDQCFYADEDAIAPLWKGLRFPMSTCISGWTMLNRQSTVIPDIYEDARIPHAAYQPTFVKSLAMVPIRTIDPIGAIGNYWAQPHQPTDQEVNLLQALADTTAVAIENVQVYAELEQRVRDRTAELESVNVRLMQEIRDRQQAEEQVRELSLTDELTRLHNRRGFFVLGQQQLKVVHRQQSSCCILFVDLDGLKQLNDNMGHEVGDRAIADVAEILKQTCRSSDIVARLGGDEFVIFALNYLESGKELVVRLQANIDRFNQESNRCYQLSISIGIHCCIPDGETSLEQLIALADELMYAQKRTKKRANR
ncbi:diguanylate cyclase [Microcoleus sp. F8-D3]